MATPGGLAALDISMVLQPGREGNSRRGVGCGIFGMTPLGIERAAAFSFHKISQASHNQVLTNRILMLKKLNLTQALGLPCGPVVKNPPANARETGSIPGAERSYMPRINKAPCAAVAEHRPRKGQLLKLGRLQPLLGNREATEISPHSLPLEKTRAATKTQHRRTDTL